MPSSDSSQSESSWLAAPLSVSAQIERRSAPDQPRQASAMTSSMTFDLAVGEAVILGDDVDDALPCALAPGFRPALEDVDDLEHGLCDAHRGTFALGMGQGSSRISAMRSPQQDHLDVLEHDQHHGGRTITPSPAGTTSLISKNTMGEATRCLGLWGRCSIARQHLRAARECCPLA